MASSRSRKRLIGAGLGAILALGGTVGLSLGTSACKTRGPAATERVIVLGVDGMDPKFIRRHADRLPNLMRLAEMGGFVDLETTMPPQSPVAWSSVITGTSPGAHGVFDFVHRDPETLEPFSSMAEAEEPEWYLPWGPYRFPLDSGETRMLRSGEPFWSVLERYGVDSIVSRMPTDFPPDEGAQAALSGMGTPDMQGGFGTFQYITSDPREARRGNPSGGTIRGVVVEDGRAESFIDGPLNTMLAKAKPSWVPLNVDVDVERDVARVEVGGQVEVLRPGEWSDWVHLNFELVAGFKSASGVARLYLKEIDPYLKLYISPVNVDPSAPELPITVPAHYAEELARDLGPFYTQGMAEETKGLSAHVLDRDEFVEQARFVMNESVDMYHREFSRFDDGMLFFYFSSVDQAGHMLFGDYDGKYLWFYERVDEVIGWTLDRMGDDTTLMVMSDHGFARFDREVNINTWLYNEGYMTLDPDELTDEPGFPNVDWTETQAYSMGLNGLYLNLEGREADGIVRPDEVEDLLASIEDDLLQLRDPTQDKPVVQRVYRPNKTYTGTNMEYSPDLVIGFTPGYRMGPDAGLGAVYQKVVRDNHDEWIGDHCMVHTEVPGVLLSNRAIIKPNPSLVDVPVTVLSLFGVPVPAHMTGTNALALD